MAVTLARWGEALGLMRPESLETTIGPEGPRGALGVPRAGDGVWEIETVQGRSWIRPDESSYYLYFTIPKDLRARFASAVCEVEYLGDSCAQFRVQYASTDRSAEGDGLYKAAEQRWQPEAVAPRPLPSPRLRRHAHTERGGLFPHRVPEGSARLARDVPARRT